MNIGVVFPQTEIGADPVAVRDYAQTVEGLGYSHILAYDHILGANPDRPGGWRGPYTYQSNFYEPFVLYSYVAAITDRLGLTTGIIILPQRQMALVAKQAATLDVLSGGRVRLGVGLGWNEVEYVALNQDFHTRGRRIEEQVELMRALWTQPLVNFKGRWHEIPDAGIKPLPVQRPIPIWFGGQADPVLQRVARLGDGWMPYTRTPQDARPMVEKLNRYLEEEGRDPKDLGIEARIPYGEEDPDRWNTLIQNWEDLGASYFSINTMGLGFDTPGVHLDALKKFAAGVNLST